jgi:hypothetical protein
MKWVTRERPMIDRIAWPWLVARFIDKAPEAAGLFAISRGLSQNFSDDYEMLRHGIVMYDALYTWCAGRSAGTRGAPTAG